MEVHTFIPTYSTKETKQRRTKSTTLGSGDEFNYRRMRIRADLIDRLDSAKSTDKTLTAFLNEAVERFLDTVLPLEK